MANDASYVVEENEDAVAGDTLEGRVVVSLGAARSTGIVPLAFTIADNLPPIAVNGLAISWTKEAIATFSKICDEARVQDPEFERNLPYASLRGLMEATLPRVSRIERGMGLDRYGLDTSHKDPTAFIYLDTKDAREAHRALRPLLDDWIAHFLVPQYLRPGEVSARLHDHVLDLARSDALVSIEEIRARLMPWNAGPTGTATPPDKLRGFQLFVDQAARRVAGCELFRALGPMRRIVTARSMTQSSAELITNPIDMGDRGLFSLVVTLEVVTFLSLGQPLLTVKVGKRLWLRRLSDKSRDKTTIGGTIFSSKQPDRAVSFCLSRKRGRDGIWRWMPDNAFEALKRELSLPLATLDGHAIANGEASTRDSRVLLVHRDSVSAGRHGIKRGVPELDKLDAFHALAAVLAPICITPFAGYTRLYPRHGNDHEQFARMINAPTLGPKQDLPGKDMDDARRTQLRVQVWRPLAQQIANKKRRTFCLVMARDRYPDQQDIHIARKDDGVNKAAARQALATIGACVQYLLPPKTSRDTETIDLANFLHRAQAALKDLIWAHSGRIEGVREAVARCFGDTEQARTSMPREIIGITIVRKNAGRSRGSVGATYLPIAVRIDVETGRCEMCCAYERGTGLTVSRWERFSDALVTVSRVSPIRLAEKREIARTRFMTFVERVVSASVEDGAQPAVIVDSSNCVQLWGWLADQRLDVSNIEIGQKQWMHEAWKGARIIRIRQDLAPGIVEGKEQHWALSSVDDARPKDTLVTDVKLDAPSSPFGLFRLDSTLGKTGCVCYLSVGHKTLLMKKRGPSCYRTTEAAIPHTVRSSETGRTEKVRNAAGLPLSTLVRPAPWINQWPTPNPLEIVVTLRQSGDNPDRLAELVERLRYGFGHYAEWTSLPAPLFFERVVRDYISGFALVDAGEDDLDGDEAESD